MIIILLFMLFTALYGYPITPPPMVSKNTIGSHNWYVIGKKNDFDINVPKKILIKNKPITVWRDNHDNFAGISDICPHRGASLAKGRIDTKHNCVVCPYHTFKFNKCGRLVATPGRDVSRKGENFNLKTDVPHYKIRMLNDWVYLYNVPLVEMSQIGLPSSSSVWVEPEAFDPSFKSVTLSKKFKMDGRTVTENSLDILHISEVHSFGNKKRPLPIQEKTEKIADGHYRVSYEYYSGEDSIASRIFNIDKLIVENEYVLPHYTVARVKFGDYVNTIVTSALPIDDDNTELFVKAYRNNWVFNIPFIDYFFDKITIDMMEKTLCEDKAVIETIYPEYKDGNFITKYDDLVKHYREDYKNFVYKDE